MALLEHAEAVVAHVVSVIDESERLLLTNRIFLDRLEDVGVISAADAISLGWTGPTLARIRRRLRRTKIASLHEVR